MNFDAGTWWLALLLLGGLTGGFWFLLKRTVFERVDKLERSVGESVKKGDYDKDMKEVREDIEKIKANYITKEDFFREQAKTDRKLDRIMDILLEMKGDKKGEYRIEGITRTTTLAGKGNNQTQYAELIIRNF